jgi:hypothetical protein
MKLLNIFNDMNPVLRIFLFMVALFAMFWFRIPMAGSALLLLGATCIFSEHSRYRTLYIDGVSDPAAGYDDQFLFHIAFFHVERICLSHQQHARAGAVADLSEPVALFAGDHPGHLSQRHGNRRFVAPVSGIGYSGRGRFYRSGQPFSEALGLKKCGSDIAGLNRLS